MPDYDVIVAGAGLGGLTAGSLCAYRGLKTLVLEQSDIIGGCCSTFESKGYRFDVGASIVEVIRPLEVFFEKMGLRLSDRLELIPCDPIYSFVTPDGRRFSVPQDLEETMEVVKRIAPEDYQAWRRFTELGMWLINYSLDAMMTTPMNTFVEALKLARRYPRLYRILPFFLANHEMVMSRRFTNNDLLTSVSFQSYYAGAPPYIGSGIFGMIALSEHLGIYYPRGGMIAIPRAIARAGEERGMEVRTGCRVERLLIEGGRAAGVALTDGTAITSRAVVSNLNGKVTYLKLVGAERLPGWARRAVMSYQLSMPCNMVYVGLDKRPELDAHHTLIARPGLREPLKVMNSVWDDYYRCGVIPPTEMSLLCWPTEADPSLAPEGKHALNWIRNTPPPYAPLGESWHQARERMKEEALEDLKRFVLPDAEDHLDYLEVATPLDFERRLLSPQGAIYGLLSDLTTLAMFRMNNRSRVVKGLYLAGASTHFGGGVPTSVASGVVTGDYIARDLGLG